MAKGHWPPREVQSGTVAHILGALDTMLKVFLLFLGLAATVACGAQSTLISVPAATPTLQPTYTPYPTLEPLSTHTPFPTYAPDPTLATVGTVHWQGAMTEYGPILNTTGYDPLFGTWLMTVGCSSDGEINVAIRSGTGDMYSGATEGYERHDMLLEIDGNIYESTWWYYGPEEHTTDVVVAMNPEVLVERLLGAMEMVVFVPTSEDPYSVRFNIQGLEHVLVDQDSCISGKVEMATPRPTAQPEPTSTPRPTPAPEPVVQVIYAIPSDRQHDTRYETAINSAILHVQDWYAVQLDGRTFAIDDPVPLVCKVGQPSKYYEGENGWDRVIGAVQHCAPVQHWSEEYVWAIYIDVEFDCNGGGELGRGAGGITIIHGGDLEGLLDPAAFSLCPGFPPRGEHGWIGGLAHELGHAFGLDHPSGCDQDLSHCDTDTLMWFGFYYNYPETYFTKEDIAILKSSPFIKP